MEVFLIMPTTPEGKAKLSKELAKFHAEQALKMVQKLPCPTEQKLELIDAVVDGDETILGIRGVNGGAIGSAGVHNREQGHDKKHCEHSAGMTKQPFHTAISFR